MVEYPLLGEAVGPARDVAVGRPVVAFALDVERGQVNAARSGRGEEEVAAFVGGEQLDEAGAAP